jgi:hypothetical protein
MDHVWARSEQDPRSHFVGWERGCLDVHARHCHLTFSYAGWLIGPPKDIGHIPQSLQDVWVDEPEPGDPFLEETI